MPGHSTRQPLTQIGLAGDVVALDGDLVDRLADLLHHGLGDADLLALLAIGGLVDRPVAGATHGLHRGRLDRLADRVPALLHDRLADRLADVIRAGPHLGARDGDLHRIPALLQRGLLHLSADGVGDLLVGALPDRHHLGGLLALHHRVLDRHLHRVRHAPRLHAGDGPADGVRAGLVARLLDRAADRVADRLHHGLLHGAADRVADVLVADLADRVADVVRTGLERRLAHGTTDRVRPGLQVGLAHGTADRVGHVFPDGPHDRPLHRVLHLMLDRPVDRPLDRVGLLADRLFHDVPDRVDRPGLHDRVAHGPHARDILRLVDGLLHVLQDRLTLELIFHVPATVLGHGAISLRCSTRVARSLRRVFDHARPHPEGQERDRQQFSQHRTLHKTSPTYFGAHRYPDPLRLRPRSGTANSLLSFVRSRAAASGSFSKFPSRLIFPKRTVYPDAMQATQTPRNTVRTAWGNRTGMSGVFSRVCPAGKGRLSGMSARARSFHGSSIVGYFVVRGFERID